MTVARRGLLCAFIGCVSANALAQTVAPAPPLDANVSLGMAFTRDLTEGNEPLRGVSGGIDWPVRPGVWLTIEGAVHRRQYPMVPPGFAPLITRGGGSVAGRWGRVSGNGPFGRIAVGHFQQGVDGGASRDRSRYGVPGLWWIGPGLGADVKLSRRLAARVLVEARVLSERVHDRRISSQVQAGLVYRVALQERQR